MTHLEPCLFVVNHGILFRQTLRKTQWCNASDQFTVDLRHDDEMKDKIALREMISFISCAMLYTGIDLNSYHFGQLFSSDLSMCFTDIF